MLSVCLLTQHSGIEINQRYKLVDLLARDEPRPHDEKGNVGASFKHRHLIELPVLHGQLPVVSRKYHDCVVKHAGLSQCRNHLTW